VYRITIRLSFSGRFVFILEFFLEFNPDYFYIASYFYPETDFVMKVKIPDRLIITFCVMKKAHHAGFT